MSGTSRHEHDQLQPAGGDREGDACQPQANRRDNIVLVLAGRHIQHARSRSQVARMLALPGATKGRKTS